MNDALLVIEMFEPLYQAALAIQGIDVSYAEDDETLWELEKALKNYDEALNKWRKSHDAIPNLPDVCCGDAE